MNRFVRVGLFAVLALGVCLLSSTITRGDDDEEQEKMDIKESGKASDSLKKLLEAIEKDKDKKDIVKCAEDLNKKTDLKHIMWAAYKPREKGGLGVGDKAGAIKPDGVEAKLINMSKKPISDAQLEKEGPALIKMAE